LFARAFPSRRDGRATSIISLDPSRASSVERTHRVVEKPAFDSRARTINRSRD
jgi:hypothetical protein